MEKKTILIIEYEIAIADLLAYGLRQEGFQTEAAHTGADGLRLLERRKPDMLLLDWMLPDASGLDICKRVTAAHNIPILMITAKSDITDKILGLEFGADDYITKPFDMREVATRIRTVFRRLAQSGRRPAEDGTSIIRLGHIAVSVEERTVRKNGAPVELTPKEFDLLIALCGYRGKIFTRDELLELVWGYDYAGDTRTVDTHIQRLRKKLDAGDLIATVFGVGYKLVKEADT